MPEITKETIQKKRMIYLALSTATLLFLGLIYAFSMFAAPMCQAFGLDPADIRLTFNIMMIAFCLGCVAGAKIEKALGVRGAAFCSAALFALGFGGTALLGSTGITAVYALYGVCAGAGVGIGYNTIIATTNVWFPDKVGFSSGVLMMGFGLSSLIFGSLSVNLYNNGFDLSSIFIGIAAAGGTITVLAGLILRKPPANIVQIMAPQKLGASSYDPRDEDKALATPLFYVYYAWAIVIIAIGLSTIGSCASDAQLVGWDAGFATLLVGLVSTTNGLGRVVVGMIYDKTNVKVTMLVDALVALAATASIVGAFMLQQPILYVVGALCCGFCYGGAPVVASAFARERFGAKNYPLNLSLINLSIIFGSALNLIIVNTMGADDRQALFTVLVVLALLAAAVVLPFSKMFDKSQKALEEKKRAHDAQLAN